MNLGDFVNYASLHAILTLEAILMEGDSSSPKSWAAGAGFSVASGKWLTLGIIFSYVKWKWEYISHSTQERIKTDTACKNTRVFWRLMVVFRRQCYCPPNPTYHSRCIQTPELSHNFSCLFRLKYHLLVQTNHLLSVPLRQFLIMSLSLLLYHCFIT